MLITKQLKIAIWGFNQNKKMLKKNKNHNKKCNRNKRKV